MKKILSLALTAATLVSMLAVSVSAALPMHTDDLYVFGDADGDKIVNAKDSNLIKSYMLGREGANEIINMDAADLMADGVINTKDLYYLKSVLAGKTDLDKLEGEYPLRNFTIGGNDISQYTIVVPEGAIKSRELFCDNNDVTYTSAYLFSDYIKTTTGKEISIATADAEITTPHVIRYIKYEPWDDEAMEFNLGNEGYIYKVENGDLYILGTLRGTLYATYELAEKYLGKRSVSNNFTFYYRHSSVDIPEGTDAYFRPRLQFRYAGQQMRDLDHKKENLFDIWYPNRLNGSQIYTDCQPYVGYQVGPHRINAHSYNEYWQMATGTLPDPSKGHYYDMYDKYFSGEKKDNLKWQPCGSSEEDYQIMFRGMLEFIDLIKMDGHTITLKYGDDSMSFSPCDNGNHCPCKPCRMTALTEGYSGIYLALANRAAEEVQEYYPGLRIFCTAGGGKVPATVRPNQYLIITYLGHSCDNHYLGKDPEHGGCPVDGLTSTGGNNIPDSESMKEWADIAHEAGATIWFWSYAVNYHFNFGGGCPNIPNIYYNFDYIINECGFDGIYYEGQQYGGNFENLKAYLAVQYMWDPDMTYDEFCDLIKEYMYVYYGNGGDLIYKFMEMHTEAGNARSCFGNGHDRPGDMISYEYMAEHYEEMRSLLLDALELTCYDEQKGYIETLLISCEFMGLSSVYDDMYTNGTAESRRTYEERYSWMYNYIVDNNIPSTDNIYPIPEECNFDINPMIQFYEHGSFIPGVTP